jgi:hypothetical protein
MQTTSIAQLSTKANISQYGKHYYKEFDNVLKELRLANGYSQEKLKQISLRKLRPADS